MGFKLHQEILKQIFRQWILSDTNISPDELDLSIPNDQLHQEIDLMIENNLIKKSLSNELSITTLGRSKFKVTLTGGAYDLLHRGHLHTLYEAAKLGDFLIVVVARDVTIKKRKRDPIQKENDRTYLLNALRIVGAAVLGDTVDHLKVVKKTNPDIIALGSDQFHMKINLEEELKEMGLSSIQVVRLSVELEGIATTRLIDEIINRNND